MFLLGISHFKHKIFVYWKKNWTKKTFAEWNVAIRIARKSTKKRRNKKFGEYITPIRYNVQLALAQIDKGIV